MEKYHYKELVSEHLNQLKMTTYLLVALCVYAYHISDVASHNRTEGITKGIVSLMKYNIASLENDYLSLKNVLENTMESIDDVEAKIVLKEQSDFVLEGCNKLNGIGANTLIELEKIIDSCEIAVKVWDFHENFDGMYLNKELKNKSVYIYKKLQSIKRNLKISQTTIKAYIASNNLFQEGFPIDGLTVNDIDFVERELESQNILPFNLGGEKAGLLVFISIIIVYLHIISILIEVNSIAKNGCAYIRKMFAFYNNNISKILFFLVLLMPLNLEGMLAENLFSNESVRWVNVFSFFKIGGGMYFYFSIMYKINIPEAAESKSRFRQRQSQKNYSLSHHYRQRRFLDFAKAALEPASDGS